MNNCLVIGQKGYISQNLKFYDKKKRFTFISSNKLNILNEYQTINFFKKNNYEYILNLCSFKKISKYKQEPSLSKKLNFDVLKNLHKVCTKFEITLIHLSSDYIYDGKKNKPYIESDKSNSLSDYGYYKNKADLYICKNFKNFYIIRVSLCYGHKGSNFYRKFIESIIENKKIVIFNNPFCTPTYVLDLYIFLQNIINKKFINNGIYNLTNYNPIELKKFIELIYKNLKLKYNIKHNLNISIENQKKSLIPNYSVLNCQKINKYFPSLKFSNYENNIFDSL